MKIIPIQPNIFYYPKTIVQNTRPVSFTGKPSGDYFVKNTKIEGIDYSNLSKPSAHLEKQIEKMLPYPKAEEISLIANRICLETGAKRETVIETLKRLSQFRTYKSLSAAAMSFAQQGIHPYSIYSNQLSSGTIAEYAGINKEFLGEVDDYCRKILGNKAKILDADNMKKDSLDKRFNDFAVINGEVPLALFDGTNVFLNGKYYSYSCFGSNISLEDLATGVIKRMQNENITLDEALNGDIIREAKKVYGEGSKVIVVKNPRVKNSEKSISHNLKPDYPSKDKIKSSIEKIIKCMKKYTQVKIKDSDYNYFISQYFEKMLVCYSMDSFENSLKELHDKIVKKAEEMGKSEQDIVYLCPDKEKSFGLVSYIYSKVNDISSDNFIIYNGKYGPGRTLEPQLRNKILVVLDDFSGSGTSLTDSQFDYVDFVKYDVSKNTNIFFAPMAILSEAKDRIDKKIYERDREHKDFIITNRVIDFEEFASSLNAIPEHTKDLLVSIMKKEAGYQKGLCCCSTPYSTHDNNWGYSQEFLKYFYSLYSNFKFAPIND